MVNLTWFWPHQKQHNHHLGGATTNSENILQFLWHIICSPYQTLFIFQATTKHFLCAMCYMWIISKFQFIQGKPSRHEQKEKKNSGANQAGITRFTVIDARKNKNPNPGATQNVNRINAKMMNYNRSNNNMWRCGGSGGLFSTYSMISTHLV